MSATHDPLNSIRRYLQFLQDQEKYDDEGYHYWTLPNPWGWERIQSGCCTNGARLIARRFNGRVFGYLFDDNPSATVGLPCGGHDFAVIGAYLVDYWAWAVSGDLTDPITPLADAKSFGYGDRECWKEMIEL